MSAAPTSPPTVFPAHGSPNWIDLYTDQVDRAKEFYAQLFKWDFRNRFSFVTDAAEVEELTQESYLARRNGDPTAEFVDTQPVFNDMTMPSAWHCNVYVDDLENALLAVKKMGGTILSGPTSRGAMATIATIADPDDGVLTLWEAGEAAGLLATDESGTLSWLELETPDLVRAAEFYSAVFGWEPNVVLNDAVLTDSGVGQNDSIRFTKRGRQVAIAVSTPLEGMPASWCPVFAAKDVDLYTVSAVRLGAVVMVEPWRSPVGRQACLVDPTGAAFTLVGPQRPGVDEL